MVTVETALGLAASMIVLVALLLALAVGRAQGQLCAAVGQGARAHSLGLDVGSAASLAYGRPVTIGVSTSGTMFTARGSAPAMTFAGWNAPALTCSVTGVEEPVGRWLNGTP